MNAQLVSVICLCYNQKPFIREAVESVIHQSYSPVQLIVVDDCSTDGSQEVIHQLKAQYPHIEMLLLKENMGNCKAFNSGLALAKGNFVIDLAADDILLPDRIKIGVEGLENAGNGYGVHFSDAELIDEKGAYRGKHSDSHPHNTIPQGDIYRDVIQRYFICPPTVMFRKSIIDELCGYDETLAYEDFDFWIRSSRICKYQYTSDTLVKKRLVRNSLSSHQQKYFNRHADSTYRVCMKIMNLNRNKAEQRALQKRILYELRASLRLLNVWLAMKFFSLLISNNRKQYGQ
ncbi:MAG: glycosyltransferase family 2 protein [Cyclobacteriaceae bacterium]|nr:glycosyltransferase family 2 protein [Cyclobacteriaceae bacterium]